jgi:RNA polymerase sigma factor (sigma-70 family)
MNTSMMSTPPPSDEHLWRESHAGDRDAFGRIVERYQSLICAIAYSRIGNLAASQDLAQETFVTAWRDLGQIREPAKLRSWLCGIARNLAANARRRHVRRGGEPAALDTVAEPTATGADPEALAVSREEETLLWRALEGMPESYREPLVLFYREGQSVAEVATQLELSQDAVKQRLSRGRGLLRDELAAVVESALSRSRPNATFTAVVLTAIAVGSTTTAKATAAVLAGQGAVSTAQGAAATGLGAGAVAGPIAGLGTAWIAATLIGRNARSERERRAIARQFRIAIAFTLSMVALLLAALYFGLPALKQAPITFAAVVVAWTAVLLTGLIAAASRLEREIGRIRHETGTEDAAYSAVLAGQGLAPAGRRRYESSKRFLGLPLYSIAPPSLDAGASRPRTARGWIAVGDMAISPLIAIGGVAVAPLAIGGVTVGLISLSIGGIAVGALALGSLAAGWVAMGILGVGWKGAAGVIAIAHDYALGPTARALEANSPVARDWFASQWFTVGAQLFFLSLPLVILLAIVVPLGLLARRAWKLRRLR